MECERFSLSLDHAYLFSSWWVPWKGLQQYLHDCSQWRRWYYRGGKDWLPYTSALWVWMPDGNFSVLLLLLCRLRKIWIPAISAAIAGLRIGRTGGEHCCQGDNDDVLSFHSKIVGEIFCGEPLSHEGGQRQPEFSEKNLLHQIYCVTTIWLLRNVTNSMVTYLIG